MPWIRRKLRDSIIYVKATPAGEPVISKDGRVEVKYKPTADAKVYRAYARNLEAAPEQDDELIEIETGEPGGAAAGEAMPADAIVVYTDGACTGNPGPAGIGVVIIDGDKRVELSEYLGEGTNNIAELTAIERALEELVEHRARPVIVHSDSSYSIGLLTKSWKPKANVVLVERLRRLARGFTRLRLVKVKGHAGIPENERCDELARRAIIHR